MKTILLLFTICQASIEKWAIKHGVTFHPEKLRWRQVSKKTKMLNLRSRTYWRHERTPNSRILDVSNSYRASPKMVPAIPWNLYKISFLGSKGLWKSKWSFDYIGLWREGKVRTWVLRFTECWRRGLDWFKLTWYDLELAFFRLISHVICQFS